jgi:type I restriction enzyme S subunit
MSLVDCLIDNNMMAVTPNDAKGHLKYHYYLMSVIQMEWFSNPGAVPSVDMNRFLSFSIPNIEHQEQKAIADYLDQKLDQIDSHVIIEKTSIELLKEYRISLISEVVTGKIDVRN